VPDKESGRTTFLLQTGNFYSALGRTRICGLLIRSDMFGRSLDPLWTPLGPCFAGFSLVEDIVRSPRVHAELRALGVRCNRKHVGRLMRKDGLECCMRARRRKHHSPESSCYRRPGPRGEELRSPNSEQDLDGRYYLCEHG
jgi:transposase InsO family protein